VKAIATLNAWKDFARANNRAGGDNVFVHNGAAYSFDARPRKLENGALQGHIYRQFMGQPPADIGGFKINADGDVVSLPQELHHVLPMGAPIKALATVDRFSIQEDVQ